MKKGENIFVATLISNLCIVLLILFHEKYVIIHIEANNEAQDINHKVNIYGFKSFGSLYKDRNLAFRNRSIIKMITST